MKTFSRAIVLSLASGCVASAATAQVVDLANPTARQIASGVQANARAGATLDGGDVSGDVNNRDLIVRSPNWSSNQGEVRIVFGWLRTEGDFSLSVADVVLMGTAAGDRFGTSTTTGFVTTPELDALATSCPAGRSTCARDLVVGAPGAAGGKGEVYLFAAPLNIGDVKTPAAAAFRIIGNAGDQLGSAVETADLNGDGFREVIASAPGNNRVYVIDLRGSASVRDLAVTGPTVVINGPAGVNFGAELATGDLTADGLFDLAIGAAQANAGAGQVFIVKGRVGATPSPLAMPANADHVLSGADAGDHAGSALWIADVDGDLTRDLIVTAPDADGPANGRADAGEAYIVFGSAALAPTLAPNVTIYGAAAGNRIGADLAAGDVTRDNPDDIALLAPGGNGGTGQIEILYGHPQAEFPSQIDLASGFDRRILGDTSTGPLEAVLVWEVAADGAEDIVGGVPSGSSSAGAEAGRLYFTLSPMLSVAPASIAMTVLENAGGSTSVSVQNNTLLPVTFGVAKDQTWLTVTPASGTTTLSAPATVTVAFAASLAPGVYAGTVTVASTTAALTASIPIPVTLTVAGVRISIDAPANGASIKQPFGFTGWAIDLGSTTGTGVDQMHVYAFPGGGGAPIFLGTAGYGAARPDVGALFGSRYTNSGFGLTVRGLAPGPYRLQAFARSTVTGGFTGVATADVTIQDNTLLAVDAPASGATVASPFAISGWAADLGAPSGVGVDTVHAYATPASGSQIFLGSAAPSAPRPDVGAAFGSQFTNSGFTLNVTSLAAGTYTLVIYAHSTLANAFTAQQSIPITVSSGSPGPGPDPGPGPRIAMNRTALYFGAMANGSASTGPQLVTIDNIGGAMSWTVSADQPWVVVSPASGVGTGTVTVSIASGTASSASTLLTITAAGATNSPRSLPVTFTVHASVPPPGGVIETPLPNATGVTGSLPVTGWAVHDIQIASVKIWRDPVAGEPAGARIFIGDATVVDGARPDIETVFPKPFNYAAGWGYMLLTNMLPNQGNGTFTLHAIATGADGSSAVLGSRTIACDNANATRPFGTIDTPAQGGTASGSAYMNFGWVLTPSPASIPEDGSTLRVYIDGMPVGQPVYDNARPDIAQLFPGYANTDGPVGYLPIDTTALANGVHTISWSVSDNLGRAEGIGSRFFTVLNGAGGGALTASGAGPAAQAAPDLGELDVVLASVPVDERAVTVRHGAEAHADSVAPDADGVRRIAVRELERLELELASDGETVSAGYLLVKGELRALPTGSRLDSLGGTFYWQPGVGYIGAYDLVFVRTSGGERSQVRVRVTIDPLHVPEAEVSPVVGGTERGR